MRGNINGTLSYNQTSDCLRFQPFFLKPALRALNEMYCAQSNKTVKNKVNTIYNKGKTHDSGFSLLFAD